MKKLHLQKKGLRGISALAPRSYSNSDWSREVNRHIEGEGLEVGLEGALEVGEWVWVEGGAPAGSRRVEVVEGQCIHEEASVEEVHAYHAEA